MCGFVGVFDRTGTPVAAGLLRNMADRIAHRGPDSDGYYVDGPVGLGHRRLAIIDLSSSGQQPMTNETNDIFVVFNGEIYNFQQLRVELLALGHRFFSKTDTEVIVHAYEEWGRDCVQRFNGMFAFALWDQTRQQLLLARDRYGVKPLYWWFKSEILVFGSEIKAILQHPAVSASVCLPALNENFSIQNIFSDLTLFEGIRLLPPAVTMRFPRKPGTDPDSVTYWDYQLDADAALPAEEEIAEAVHKRFVQAVTRQLISDVPVGTYLSGGMDSGSITAIAARHVERLTTFTAGFDLSSATGLEMGFDERRAAEMMANFFKTEHYEVVLHAGDMEWVMPKLIWHLEDLRVGQCYPNYYVARLASKFVKVVLSGAGGDELFGGYPWRYFRGLNSSSCSNYFARYYQFWQRLVPDDQKSQLFNSATCRLIRDHSTFDVFRGIFRDYRGAYESNADFVNASLYFELKTFLHGLLLVEDKISMAHSLETRVPFLDDDLVDLALHIPPSLKLRDLASFRKVDENQVGKRHLNEIETSEGKMILRTAMSRIIPKATTDRTKQGFSAPDASWFRGQSIDYINRLLRDPTARIYDYLNLTYVRDHLDRHCAGQANYRLLIWSLLSFEWWLRIFIS
jgi:asparagine synthase (glutamine-hydrolysing)